MCRKKKRVSQLESVHLDRTNEQSLQPQTGPFPMSQSAGQSYHLPNLGQFHVTSNGMPLGLPQFTSIDEYGRAFTPIMSYGPQPNSSPVPIATPSKIVQMSPIVSPIAFVPYSTQNQGLYQLDEEEE